jgi:hypothetical protein
MDSSEWERTTMMTKGTPSHPLHLRLLPCLSRLSKEEDSVEMVPEQEAPMAHEVILADAELELPQPHLFNMIMRDYEESPPRMENGPHELDDLDDLDNSIEVDYDVDEWFPEDGSSDRF